MQKRIPYGVANYREIASEAYYFVDKTRYIRELERFKTPVFLRSRRFGKSLWCSILEHYYDVRFADAFETLFGKTDIGRNPTERRNSCIVVRMSFSSVEVSPRYDELMANFNRTVGGYLDSAIVAHDCLKNAPGIVRSGSATARLEGMRKAVADGRLPPLYIVIDEYDNFTNTLITSQRDDLYTEVTTGDSFLRTFFKSIKDGVGEGTIANVFITGVLPVTMDDLTSGYNIAQLVTFEPMLLHMLGFTQGEVDAYVDELFADHPEWPPALKTTVRADLKANYDGYHLLPGAPEAIYNSTVTNYYLDYLNRNGTPPPEKFDPNLNTDVNWIKRLARGTENAKDLVDRLLMGDGIALPRTALATTFSKERLFDPTYFPVTLYYLGLVTFISSRTVGLPNLTVRKLFTDYFNDLWHAMRMVVTDAGEIYEEFAKSRDWSVLFEGFGKRYLGILPAQAYERANENFFRSTFYLLFNELMQDDYVVRIEDNVPGGRCDLTAVGTPNGIDPSTAVVVEFKHYTRAEMKSRFAKAKKNKKGVPLLARAPKDAVEQVRGYAADFAREHPHHTVLKYVVCYFSTKGYRLWKVS